MKRDMDLVRKILVAIEEAPEPGLIQGFAVAGCTGDQLYHHLVLLHNAGMIEGVDSSTFSDYEFMPGQLTMKGNEYLDAVRSDTIWAKVKDKFGNGIATLSFDVIKAAATAYVMGQIP